MLIGTLSEIAANTSSCFSDSILQLDCVACIRTFINHKDGIVRFLNKQTHSNELLQAINTNSALVRKNVFEVLTAIVVHSSVGHQRILTGLQTLPFIAHFSSPMALLSRELRRADSSASRTAVLALINALLTGCESLLDRIQMRIQMSSSYQFMELIEVMSRELKDADLIMQVRLYITNKEADDECVRNEMYFDVNSPNHVYLALKSLMPTSEESFMFLQVLYEYIAMQSCKDDLIRRTKWRTSLDFLRQLNTCAKVTDIERAVSSRNGSSTRSNKGDLLDAILAGSPDVRSVDKKDSGISMTRQSVSPRESGEKERRNNVTFERGSAVRLSDRGPLSESQVSRAFPGLPFRKYGSARLMHMPPKRERKSEVFLSEPSCNMKHLPVTPIDSYGK